MDKMQGAEQVDLAFLARMGIDHPDLNPDNLPPSLKHAYGDHPTLQSYVDELERDEEETIKSKMAVREFGYSWMIPLGRQHTLEEDAESSEEAGSHRMEDSPRMDAVDDSWANEPQRDLDADIEDADTTNNNRTLDSENDASSDRSANTERMQR